MVRRVRLARLAWWDLLLKLDCSGAADGGSLSVAGEAMSASAFKRDSPSAAVATSGCGSWTVNLARSFVSTLGREDPLTSAKSSKQPLIDG